MEEFELESEKETGKILRGQGEQMPRLRVFTVGFLSFPHAHSHMIPYAAIQALPTNRPMSMNCAALTPISDLELAQGLWPLPTKSVPLFVWDR